MVDLVGLRNAWKISQAQNWSELECSDLMNSLKPWWIHSMVLWGSDERWVVVGPCSRKQITGKRILLWVVGEVYVLPYPFAVSHFLCLLDSVWQAVALGWSPYPMDWHFWNSESIEPLPSLGYVSYSITATQKATTVGTWGPNSSHGPFHAAQAHFGLSSIFRSKWYPEFMEGTCQKLQVLFILRWLDSFWCRARAVYFTLLLWLPTTSSLGSVTRLICA